MKRPFPTQPRAPLRAWSRRLARSLLAVAALTSSACDDEQATDTTSASREEVAEQKVDFEVGPETKGALYTWVDDEGSFQLTEDPTTIPAGSRSPVRVVVDGHPPGSPEYVYVADLDDQTGGQYALSSMPRTEWESIGKKARDKRVAALSPEPAPDASERLAAAGVDAIIYGADWCKPCHLAEDYLRSRGAQVIKKDIEEDPTAAREMQQVLKSAGMSGSSIPVLNVGGTVLRGFSQKAIDAALSRVRRTKTD